MMYCMSLLGLQMSRLWKGQGLNFAKLQKNKFGVSSQMNAKMRHLFSLSQAMRLVRHTPRRYNHTGPIANQIDYQSDDYKVRYN